VTRTLGLELEYDGSGFHGWARQPALRTVQGVVEEALDAIFPDRGPLTVAGRTDTGVHASGQVASLVVETGPPAQKVPLALNQLLPDDVAITACREHEEGFNARFSARSRAYEYRVLLSRVRSPLRASRVHHHPRPVEFALLEACAALLPGEHDFRAFTPTVTEHEVFRREIRLADWRREGDEAVFRIEADSFLRHMVRILVGTMLGVAGGRFELSTFEELLAGADRTASGETAPPHGLCLVAVRYEH
jgi:tRNA pseudouridine38-40 synthase